MISTGEIEGALEASAVSKHNVHQPLLNMGALYQFLRNVSIGRHQ